MKPQYIPLTIKISVLALNPLGHVLAYLVPLSHQGTQQAQLLSQPVHLQN